MTKLYSATKAADIAAEFRRMAKNAWEASLRTGQNVNESKLCRRENVIWEQAANMIDNTEFVGWQFDQPTKDTIG